jgi:plastocyanin
LIGFDRISHNPCWIVPLLLLLAVAPPVATAATARLKLKYARSTRPPKDADHSNIVVWLSPLSDPALGEAERALHLLPRHYHLLQKKKQFTPHLQIIPAGSVVDFPNQDPFFHNVFSLFDGRRFDLGLYEAGATRSVHFDRPGVSFIFCNIHPQMSALLIVLKTPYFGISDRTGDIVISNVPPGRYRLAVWSERSSPETLQALTREITISEEKDFSGSMAVEESGDLLAGHKNKYGRDYEPVAPEIPGYHQPD